jgi:hypothetical protein
VLLLEIYKCISLLSRNVVHHYENEVFMFSYPGMVVFLCVTFCEFSHIYTECFMTFCQYFLILFLTLFPIRNYMYTDILLFLRIAELWMFENQE